MYINHENRNKTRETLIFYDDTIQGTQTLSICDIVLVQGTTGLLIH